MKSRWREVTNVFGGNHPGGLGLISVEGSGGRELVMVALNDVTFMRYPDHP